MTASVKGKGLDQRWRNALLVAGGLLLSCLLMITSLWRADRQDRTRMDAFRLRVADMAKIAESIITGQLHQYDNSLLMLRDAYVANPKQFRSAFRLLRSGPLADPTLLVVLVDRDGYLMYTDAPNVQPRLYLGDRKYFRFFADGGKDRLYIDEPSFGRVTKRYTIALSRPIYDRQGDLLGVVAISVKQESLTNFPPHLQLSGDTTISVINHSGAVVSRSRDFNKVQGTIVSKEIMALMLKDSEGFISSRHTPDGDDNIIAYRHIHNGETPLIAYAETSPADLRKDISLQSNVLIWTGGFTSLIIMALIAIYIRSQKTSRQLIDALKSSKEKEFNALTQASLDGFWITDTTGQILDTNDTFCKMLGYERDEILSMTIKDIEAVESPEQISDRIHKVVRVGTDFFESRYLCKDGSIKDVEISAQYISEPKGLFFVFTRDITKRKQDEETLRQSQQKLELTLRSAGAGTWDWDMTTQRLEWSKELYNLFGIDPNGVQATFDIWDKVLHPEDKEGAYERINHTIKERNPLYNEYRVVLPDGSIHWINALGNTTYDESGQAVRMAGICTDITKRKQAEEALHQQQRENLRLISKLNEAQQIARIGSWDWDLIANTVWWSDETYQIFGVSRASYVPSAENNARYYHPDDLEPFAQQLNKTLASGIPLETELRLVLDNGQLKHCYAKAIVTLGKEGNPIRLSGIIMDINERKRTEEALREKENLLSETQSIAHIGSWMVTLPTMKALWSDEAYRICGVNSDTFIPSAESLLSLIINDDRKAMEGWIHACISGKNPPELEFRIVRPDGTIRHLCGRGYLQLNNDHKPICMVGSMQDITELKQAEGEKESLRERLTRSQKMESIGQLAGGVAHDFNNMLGVILGHAEMAMEQVDPTQPLYADLQEIQKAAERSSNLTRQLLAFARKQTVSPKILNLNETVAGMIKMLRRLIGEDIQLAWLPGANLWPVNIDPSQIDQILANLCVNARDAISGVGKVTIETENVIFGESDCANYVDLTPGEYVHLAVSDDGCGMGKDTQSHLFEPFFTTKETGRGTGLGLATVYGIVKQNNGFINVSSEPNRGTTFHIYIPRHMGKTEQEGMEGVAEPVRRGHETILVVEDEPALLELSKNMLEKLGYRVLTAGTPSEAILLAEEQSGEIHLLITDVVMPKMDGRNLSEKLLSLCPNMKSLFMSGYTADIIAHHGVLDAGLDFIQKPFSRRNLAAKVREVLDRK